MPFGLGAGELIGLLLLVLLLFGAKRIPEIAGSFGKGINEFKRNIGDAQRAITDPAREEPRTIAPAQPPVVAPPVTAEEEAARQPKRLIG